MDNNTFPEEITKQTGLSADEYQYIFDFETTRGAQDLEVGERVILLVNDHSIFHANWREDNSVSSGPSISLHGKASPSTKKPLDKAYIRFLEKGRAPKYTEKYAAIELTFTKDAFSTILEQLRNPPIYCWAWRYGENKVYGDIHSSVPHATLQ